jgi:hypothetical protein
MGKRGKRPKENVPGKRSNERIGKEEGWKEEWGGGGVKEEITGNEKEAGKR